MQGLLAADMRIMNRYLMPASHAIIQAAWRKIPIAELAVERLESAEMKRAFDLALVLPALLILLPVMALVAMLVRFSIGTPVLFRQLRPGLDGKPFELIKFRTMTNERSPDGASLPDARRLGRVGRLLRASSLDELPELFNVLRGEMSLVGPRPLLMEYLPLYDRDLPSTQARAPGCDRKRHQTLAR